MRKFATKIEREGIKEKRRKNNPLSTETREMLVYLVTEEGKSVR